MRHKSFCIISSVKANIFCLCFFSATAFYHGQMLRQDSIALDPIEKDLRLKNPETAFWKPLEFSEARVYLNTEYTPLKRVQTPKAETQYGFGSSGIFEVNKKVWLTGTLDVNRVDERAVPYILTDERTKSQSYISNPSYFYAPRKSDWLNQNYALSGKIAYQPVKNLIAVLGVEGRYLKAYSNSDPRPEIGNFRYLAEGKVGYKIGKHGIFVKGNYFNNKKESDITYNVSELNAPTSFNTYIRFNKGYGNYYYNSGYAKTEYQHDGFSYGGEYHFTSQKSFFMAGYENTYFIDRMYWYYNQQLKDENNVPYYIRTKMKLTGLKTDRNIFYADYLGNISDYKWSSAVVVTDQKDINYDYANVNTSYVAYNTSANFTNYFSRYNAKNELLRLGVQGSYGDTDVRDFSVVMHRKLQFLQIGFQLEKELRIAANQKISVEITPGIYLPLSSLYDFQPYQGSENNIFIANIAAPDYAYDTSRKFSLGFQLKYIFDRKKIRYEAYAGSSQLYFLSNAANIRKNLLSVNSNQLLNFGINFRY